VDEEHVSKKGPDQVPGADEPKDVGHAAHKQGPDQPPGGPVKNRLKDDDGPEREQGERGLAF
jgi:hypothetical protein